MGHNASVCHLCGATHKVPIREDMTRALYVSFPPSPIGPRVTRAASEQNTGSIIPSSLTANEQWLQVEREEQRVSRAVEVISSRERLIRDLGYTKLGNFQGGVEPAPSGGLSKVQQIESVDARRFFLLKIGRF
jgi:hypothetical protein